MRKVLFVVGIWILFFVVSLFPVVKMAYRQQADFKNLNDTFKQERASLKNDLKKDFGVDISDAKTSSKTATKETQDIALASLKHPAIMWRLDEFKDSVRQKQLERYGDGKTKGTLQRSWEDFADSGPYNRISYKIYSILKWIFHKAPGTIIRIGQRYLIGEASYELTYGERDASTGDIVAKSPTYNLWNSEADVTESVGEVVWYGIGAPVIAFMVLMLLIGGIQKLRKK